MKRLQKAAVKSQEPAEGESWLARNLFPLIGLRPVTEKDHDVLLERKRDLATNQRAVLEASAEYQKNLDLEAQQKRNSDTNEKS